MASGWVKSLHCKSRVFEDVFNPVPRKALLSSSASCRSKTSQSIKDVIEPKTFKRKTSTPKSLPSSPPPKHRPPAADAHPESGNPVPAPNPITRPHRSVSARSYPSQPQEESLKLKSLFPGLSEIPEGHPSRKVVEIIFHTSWSPKAFTGGVEAIFKVQNATKTVARFEEYRETVKARAGSGAPVDEENSRCVADGNEVMRFHCLGPAPRGGSQDECGGPWTFPCKKGAAICTFSGSREAHENAGGGKGRRTMLLCRVVAGRTSKRLTADSLVECRVGFDSVSGDSGELFVFDTRAVLPCFLIIYRL